MALRWKLSHRDEPTVIRAAISPPAPTFMRIRLSGKWNIGRRITDLTRDKDDDEAMEQRDERRRELREEGRERRAEPKPRCHRAVTHASSL